MTFADRSVIVVSIDRLGAPFLGPYGNTWIETPHFNRLASRSFLFEFPVAETVDLQLAYRSYWYGAHALASTLLPGGTHLPGLLADRGMPTALVTDEPLLAEHDLAAAFGEQIILPPSSPSSPAGDETQTEMARLFATATDWLQQARPPFLLWLHSRGMSGPWDAPLELRNQFADEDDPPPPDLVDPPNRQLAPGFDPDEILGITQAYAGQVILADICLGALLAAVDSVDDTLLIVTSPRGFALGEHLAVGSCGDALFGETLAVPLLVRLPRDEAATQRSDALVQNSDLFATFADWFSLSADSSLPWGESLLPLIRGEASQRQLVCSSLGNERSIRTPAWFLRQSSAGRQLYAKPDDRWEVNDVADRCGDIAERLQQALAAFETAVAANRRTELPKLDEVLIEGLE